MMTTKFFPLLFSIGLLLPACGDDSAGADAANERAIALAGEWDTRLSAEELERGRFDHSWQQVVQLDTVAYAASENPNAEEWEQISSQTVNSGLMQLPLYHESTGPSVLRAQILLDRALFSPGIIDGRWGKNTEKAVYWFQQREGLGRTGRIDQETFERMVELADAGPELIVEHSLVAEEVEGPFLTIPEDIYEKAELDCMCYESLAEKLAERFHTSPEVLRQLNPEIDLNALGEGDRIQVPSVREADAGRAAQVARLVISADGFYVHALDGADRLLFHFPSTMGSSFDPSPSGIHRVTSITEDPWWHYQPSILEHVDDSEEEARIPPGPNNAVGVVWMALSIPHYGIHGTSAPETIGYSVSAGCIRLTNWDARFLSERITEGIEVDFTESGAADPMSTD